MREGVIMRIQSEQCEKFDFVKYVASDICLGVKESNDPLLREIRVTKNTRRLTDNQS